MTNYNDGQMQWISEEIGRDLGKVGSEGLIRAEMREKYDLSPLQLNKLNQRRMFGLDREWFISTPLDARGKRRGWRIVRSDKATKAQLQDYAASMDDVHEGTVIAYRARMTHPAIHRAAPQYARKVELQKQAALAMERLAVASKTKDKKAEGVVMSEIKEIARAMAAL